MDAWMSERVCSFTRIREDDGDVIGKKSWNDSGL